MPSRGLPGNANLEQLRNGAKSFQRAVRAGDPGAAAVVNEFHPRLGSARPGSPELAAFTRADAQLVVARQFGFPSWPRLKAHLELVADRARSPHHEPVGGPLTDETEIVDEFLRLVTLNYGDDDPGRLARAEALLFEHEWLAAANVYTIAATGELDAARDLLADDPAVASRVGGPHRWEPLLYLTYARLPLSAGRSPLAVARLLLEYGADPNAGYLWEGLIPPFTALTGALGGGGTIPKHPQELALARLLLEAGADPNDGQALYNQGWGESAGEEWLELLFEFGLGSGDGGPWRRRFGERQDSPQKMLEDLLIAAAKHGFADRVRWLLARGVDPRGELIEHPIYRGRSPVQEAALNGHMEIVAMLVDAGAVWEHDQVDELIATAMSGDRDGVQRLLAADPGLRERAIERSPDQLVRAAEQDSYEAVALLIELGFDVNARSRTAPLHEAAMRGNLPVIRLLLEHGADPNLRDTGYDATPAGWAEHHEQPEAYALLAALERPDTRTAEDPAGAVPGVGEPARAGGPVVPGAAMRTVAAAFTAVSERRFDALAELVAPDIDWRGIAEADGSVPRCTTRAQAIERMQVGLLARGQVSVRSFVEEGNRVLAHVHHIGDDTGPHQDREELPRAERFVVAEVQDGLIVGMSGYAAEDEARAALSADASGERPAGEEWGAPGRRGVVSAPVLEGVVLRGLTTVDVAAIAGWFEDPDTRRFLGGPEWPARMLALAERAVGTVFRGARQLGAYHYLAIADGTPAGYVDCGTFDRCTVYGGEGPDGPIILETIEAVTGSIAFVVDPAVRGRGLGRAMIAAMLARAELRDVELFEAGIEPQNTASRRCLEAAGFELRSPEPDFEGMLYYRCWRRELVERATVSG